MKITKNCIYTNRKNTLDINITAEQYTQFKQGEDIDLVMPDITYEERTFLLTGALPDDEDSVYQDGDDTFHHHGHMDSWDWH